MAVRLGVLMVVLAAPSSCGRGSQTLPASPPVVDVVMKEYSFALSRPVPRGRVVFRVKNEGTLKHDLVLIVLPEDHPPLDDQLRGSVRRVVATIVSLPARGPNTLGTFAVDLPPQRYGLVCFVQDPDGGQHAQKGMNREFRVL